MKIFLIVFACTIWLTANGQQGRHANNADDGFAAPMAKMITEGMQTDRQKVKAIFDWIAQNISYQVKPWYNRNNKATNRYEVIDPSDTATILKPLNERIADLVIRRREAYCDGYARLFKTMCDYNNIPSEIITGYSATSGMDARGAKFKSNHNWNAVYIDSSWHLLDVTWASGFTTYAGNEFIPRYNDYYYLTPPYLFANDHYPEDLRWTLLNTPPTLAEFRLAPYKTQAYITNKIASHFPEKGTVSAIIGDSIYFVVQLNPSGMKENCDDSSNATTQDTDTLLQNVSSLNWVNISPTQFNNVNIYYAFRIGALNIQYVNLVLNGRIILRYRLKVFLSKENLANNN